MPSNNQLLDDEKNGAPSSIEIDPAYRCLVKAADPVKTQIPPVASISPI